MRVLGFVLVCLLAPTSAFAAACAGKDLLPALRTNDPAAYVAVEAKAVATPNGQGLLWRIEDGKAAPSYLFGTIHVSDPRVTELAPVVRDSFAASTTIAVEIAGATAEDVGQALMKRALVEKGGTLSDLPPEARADIEKAIAARGVPAAAGDVIERWFLMMLLAFPSCVLHDSGSVDALDLRLENDARVAGKQVVGLETQDEQLDVFIKLDRDLATRNLVAAARNDGKAEDLHETLLSIYLSRNIGLVVPALAAAGGLTPEESAASDELARRMVDPRNLIMFERALPYVREGGVFIAVGALHLPGEAGLVELFRRGGFTATRVW